MTPPSPFVTLHYTFFSTPHLIIRRKTWTPPLKKFMYEFQTLRHVTFVQIPFPFLVTYHPDRQPPPHLSLFCKHNLLKTAFIVGRYSDCAKTWADGSHNSVKTEDRNKKYTTNLPLSIPHEAILCRCVRKHAEQIELWMLLDIKVLARCAACLKHLCFIVFTSLKSYGGISFKKTSTVRAWDSHLHCEKYCSHCIMYIYQTIKCF